MRLIELATLAPRGASSFRPVSAFRRDHPAASATHAGLAIRVATTTLDDLRACRHAVTGMR
jgi:hypothetical protein